MGICHVIWIMMLYKSTPSQKHEEYSPLPSSTVLAERYIFICKIGLAYESVPKNISRKVSL